jgi:aminopeptidase YwaD
MNHLAALALPASRSRTLPASRSKPQPWSRFRFRLRLRSRPEAVFPARPVPLSLCLCLPVLLSLAGCSSETQQRRGVAAPAIEEYFDEARATFSGENALETVAFMEGTFRLPGNSGFDASIARVVEVLEGAGYVPEERAHPGAPLTYRVERRAMDSPTWEPVEGALDLPGEPGEEDEPLLSLSTNLNMIAINSWSTPPGGTEAELVYVGDGGPEQFDGLDVRGKIVFGETSVRRLFVEAVQTRGALGVLSYSMPAYTQPERNPTSIQFSSIPLDAEAQSWGLRLSYGSKERLREALEAGRVRVRVSVETRIYEAEELTLVADVHGRSRPDERFVMSAHVQEPGANDNASGVAVQAEVARVLGTLVGDGRFVPARTISMVWGDEITSTRRYVEEDPDRASGIRWGVSLDMVGQDTDKTGGSFLIEKMPDPSAIWTRGEDRHTEWWGEGRSRLTVDELTPHYLNDFILGRCLEQAAVTGWVVRTNPFEGGSDHVPFLRAGIPGLLLWHFTDMFYHTDGDRLDKVSPWTMANVGVATTVSAMTLASAGGETARFAVQELEAAALSRLAAEFELSRAAIAAGEDRTEQTTVLEAWLDWYLEALRTTHDIEVGGSSPETLAAIEAAVARVREAGEGYLAGI